jgi:hypothetical protein
VSDSSLIFEDNGKSALKCVLFGKGDAAVRKFALESRKATMSLTRVATAARRALLPAALMLLLFSTSSAATPTEVWVGSDSLNGIFRYDAAGTLLGQLDFAPYGSSRTVSAIASIGGEVWTGASSLNGIFRYDTAGSLQGHIDFAPYGDSRTVSAIAQIGNEVWLGASSLNGIFRYDTAGTQLGQFDFAPYGSSRTVSAIATVGGEVWAGSDSLNGLFRYDTLGNYLGTIAFAPYGSSRSVSAIRKVGDEVWVGSGSLNGFFRHDTQGSYLGHIDFAPLGASRTVSAIAFIPEPSTALLLSLGLVGLSARRRALRWGCSSGAASFRVPSRQDTFAVRVSLNLCPTGSDFECQLAVGGFVKSKAECALDATDLHAYPSFGGRPTGVGGRSSADRGQTIGETSPQIFASTSTCWRSTVG